MLPNNLCLLSVHTTPIKHSKFPVFKLNIYIYIKIYINIHIHFLTCLFHYFTNLARKGDGKVLHVSETSLLKWKIERRILSIEYERPASFKDSS